MAKGKVALFGGTFDPIHVGHTTVAASAAQFIGAEKVILVPAKCSPLKQFSPRVSDEDRLNMISLAIEKNEKFEVSDYELKKTMPSYTLETVRKFQADLGSDTQLYWLIGADSVDELPLWYKILDLIDECNLSVMSRPGCDAPDFSKFKNIWGSERIDKLQKNVIPTPLVDASSTEVRERLKNGLDVSDMLDSAVADYIQKNKLYR